MFKRLKFCLRDVFLSRCLAEHQCENYTAREHDCDHLLRRFEICFVRNSLHALKAVFLLSFKPSVHFKSNALIRWNSTHVSRIYLSLVTMNLTS